MSIDGYEVSELTELTTPDIDDLFYIVDTSAGESGSKFITAQNMFRSGMNRVVVASADALDSVKMSAQYTCDGVDDQVQIQAAIDSLGINGGEVVLTEGIYYLGAHDNFSRVTGTGDTADSNTSFFKIDVGSNYASINVGDVLILRGGDDGGGNTMEDQNSDGVYPVNSKSAAGLGATEIELDVTLDGPWTGVTYIRPAYCLRIPKQVSIRGQGMLSTVLKLQSSEKCCMLMMYSPTTSTGAQKVYDLSVNGNSANQTGDWWEYILVATGRSYDVHVLNVELRYSRGYGLCVGHGWGYRHQGGWIEDCQVNAFVEGAVNFNGVKIQQAGETTSGGMNLVPYQTAGKFVQCELRSYDNCTSAVTLRGSRNTIFDGCEFEARNAGDTCVETVLRDNKLPVQIQMVNSYWYVNDSTSPLLTLSNYILGARLSGHIYGHPTTICTNFSTYAHGLNIDLIGDQYGMDTGQEVSHNIPAVNNTGGAAADYTAYVWDETGTKLDYRLPAAATDVPRFAGVHNTYATADGDRDYLIDYGFAYVNVDATVPIHVNDLLTLDTSGSYWGYMVRAGSGTTALALALETKSSGQGKIAVFLIAPREVPAGFPSSSTSSSPSSSVSGTPSTSPSSSVSNTPSSSVSSTPSSSPSST